MRYSKLALLTFGAGMIFGLVVVAVELPGLARVASLAMAAGIVLLPLALFADWRRYLMRFGRGAAKQRGKKKSTKRRRPAQRARGHRKH
jgi:hypothetical protein